MQNEVPVEQYPYGMTNAKAEVGVSWPQVQQERLRLFAAVVESTDDAVLTKKLDGTITGWNAGAQRLYGWSGDEVLGKSVEVIVPDDRLDELHDMLEQIRLGNRVEQFNTVRIHKDGSRINVSLRIAPVHGPEGVLEGASAIARDMRPEDRVEQVLLERTEELERSNAELQQFAYIASHDLQEPLRMIVSYTELLNEKYVGLLDERGKRYMRHVVDSGLHMQALVHELLRFSLVGTEPVHETLLDVNQVLDDVLATFTAPLREANAVITLEVMPTIEADATQLVQVFQNLVSNAIKFRSVDPLRLTIGVERDIVHEGPGQSDLSQQGGAWWKFRVVDNGIGISDEHAERIFQMFQRLHPRDEYEGSGIGLAMVRRIVQRKGGDVEFVAAERSGSEFHFTWPVAPDTVDLIKITP